MTRGDMKRETILVVDDNRQLGNFISGKLLPSLGYESLERLRWRFRAQSNT